MNFRGCSEGVSVCSPGLSCQERSREKFWISFFSPTWFLWSHFFYSLADRGMDPRGWFMGTGNGFSLLICQVSCHCMSKANNIGITRHLNSNSSYAHIIRYIFEVTFIMLRYEFINSHYKFKLFFHSSVRFSPKLQACHGHWPDEMLCQLICFILALKIWLPCAIFIAKPFGQELPRLRVGIYATSHHHTRCSLMNFGMRTCRSTLNFGWWIIYSFQYLYMIWPYRALLHGYSLKRRYHTVGISPALYLYRYICRRHFSHNSKMCIQVFSST